MHVSMEPTHIYIENSLFQYNTNNCWSLTNESTTGTGRGGAISIMDAGDLDVYNTTFIANSASIGTQFVQIRHRVTGLQMSD